MEKKSDIFVNPQIEGVSLGGVAARSFSWTTISTLVTTGLWALINVILARILSPDDFGLVGLSAVFINFANVINHLGLTAAILRQKDLEEAQVSTAFWINMTVGLFSTLILSATSGIIAKFYERPELAPVIIVASLSFFLSSFGSVHRALLTRKLEFKKLALLDIAALFASAVVSIGWALLGGGVYSLAIQEVVRGSVRAILGWIFLSWTPQFAFDWNKFRPLFKFSATVLISDIINYISASMDRFLIGKFVGVIEVGYYSLSYDLVRLPQAKIAPLLNNVSYPILSRVQDDRARLQRGYLKTIQYISLLSFPALLGLSVVAREFVLVVYGQKWEPSVVLLQLLSVAGAVYSFATTVGSFLFPCGRPDLVLKGNIYRIFLLGGCVAIGTRWGAIGVAAAVSIYTLVFLFPLYLWFLWQAGKLPPLNVLRALGPAFFCSLFMVGIIIVTKVVFLVPFRLSNLWALTIGIVVGALGYIAALWFTQRKLLFEVIDLFAHQVLQRFVRIKPRVS
ncbi:MAG: MOP flippase family protein [Anaerolineae bacterium]|nr:MOP flippase family protein [Anaerolineae bacterium]